MAISQLRGPLRPSTQPLLRSQTQRAVLGRPKLTNRLPARDDQLPLPWGWIPPPKLSTWQYDVFNRLTTSEQDIRDALQHPLQRHRFRSRSTAPSTQSGTRLAQSCTRNHNYIEKTSLAGYRFTIATPLPFPPASSSPTCHAARCSTDLISGALSKMMSLTHIRNNIFPPRCSGKLCPSDLTSSLSHVR